MGLSARLCKGVNIAEADSGGLFLISRLEHFSRDASCFLEGRAAELPITMASQVPLCHREGGLDHQWENDPMINAASSRCYACFMKHGSSSENSKGDSFLRPELC